MSNSQNNRIMRRPKAAVSLVSTNAIHLRHPLVVALWSLAYPGFGHLRLISIAKGIFLFGGELLINLQAHLNLAILYSFTGNFIKAKEVLDIRLLLPYCGLLAFSIWDSYRVAIELNKNSVLADHEKDPLTPTVLSAVGYSSLDKRNPWVAAAWAAIMPGLGHLYSLSIVVGGFVLITGLVIVYFSQLLPALFYTAIGQFDQAKAIVDWQWLINMPSFYCFSIYDAYAKTVEMNKLFDQEQAQYMRDSYQKNGFKMPLQTVKEEG